MKPSLRLLIFLLACAAFGPPRAALAQTCNQTSSLVYREANSTNVTDVEKRAATETVSGTSFTYGGYTSTASGTTTNDIFQLTSDQQGANLDARMLVWRQSNTGTSGTNNAEVDLTSPYAAQVTLTFTREVSNLSFVVQDIDRSVNGNGGSNFTDELAVYALNGAGTRVDLTNANIGYGAAGTATSSTINTFIDNITINGVTQDAVRGETLNGGVGNNPSRAGNVTINFPSPVKTVRLTFRNLNSRSDVLTGGVPLRLQTIGIEQITWCAQADVATTLTGPTAAVIGSTVTYVATIANNGADQVTSVQPTVQLPQNLTAVTGGTYVASTGLLTLAAIPNLGANASVTRNITFTMPTTNVTGVVSVPTTGNGSTTAGSSAPDPALANNNGSLANASVTTIATPPYTISGTVFEDINYGGGLGRSIATANAVTANSAVGVSTAATVELYNATTGAFVASTTTSTTAGSLGQYSFTNLPGSTSYTTRVVNATVRSTRTGSTAALLGVQTFNGTTDRVGGEAPNLTDAAANTTNANLSTLTATTGTTTAQSLAAVSIGTASVTNVDFGFNFDAVVNTNDAGQGSLRQFVLNANALGGEASLAQRGSRINAAGTTVTLPAGQETSIFMIPSGSAVAGQRAGLDSGLTNGVAVINTTTTLTLTGANANNTVIDGTTQTFNIGNTSTGTATNATATTVGVDNIALGGVQKPEVEISGSAATVIDLEATSLVLRGLAAHGGSTQTVLVGSTTASSGYLVENALIGATSDGVRPTTNASGGYGIFVTNNAGVGTVQNSLVAYNGFSGMNVRNGTGTAGTSQFVSNFFVKNGFTQGGGDGITFGDGALSGPANVANNFFTNQNSSALQFEIGTTSATTVTNNTITNSGAVGDAGALVADVEGGGIVYLQRDGTKRGSQADVISKNVITNSQSAGIVVGYGQQNVTISQNNTNGNGGLGIDLINNAAYYVGSANATGAADYGDGDGINLNDGSSVTAATALPNKGLDYPIIVSATIVGNTLVVKGYSQPGVTAEFFLRDADNGNFGEGQTYLGGGVENGTGDLNTATTTLTYSGTINGLNQGSDASNTARAYTFNLDISTLTPAQRSTLTANGITATATLSTAGTSEFSAKAPINTAPVPNTLTNVSILNTSGATVLNPNLSGTANGTLSTGAANSIASYTVVGLPASGTLTYNGTALTTANIAGTSITNPALLTYTPVAGYAGGSVSFTYTATDANGITSTTNNSGGTVTNGPATYTIPVSQVADVTTALSGPATLNQGQTTGTYTATFTNNGPNPAAGVTQQVTLPAGATLTAAQLTTIQTAYAGTTYNSATRVLYFGGTTVTLANAATNTFNFAFTAPTTTSGVTTLASAVTTTSNQGADAAANTASLNIQVNAASPNNCAVSYFNNTNSYGGLSADYYSGGNYGAGNNNSNTGFFTTNTPKLKRVDASLNFANNDAFGDLTTSGVSTATNPVNQSFSARYRGSFTITTAGSYTFSSDIDDNQQVWIDGNAIPATGAPQTTTFNPTGTPIINVTGYSNGQSASAAIPLSAGPHNILIFFGAGNGPNNITFKYSGPDTGGSTVLVPNSVLCAGPSNVPPTALAVRTAAIPNNAGPTTISPLNGTDFETTGSVTNYAIATVPNTTTQGTLRLNGVAVTANQVITAAQAATLTFQPVLGYTGADITFTFSAIDNSNQYSNTTAVYTIPVSAAADVTTTLSGPVALNAGQPSGSFTATYTNYGPAVATNVTQQVTLPAGVTNVLVNGNSYTPVNGIIDFGTATLASGATNTFTYSFTAPTTTGTVTQSSNVTTLTSEGSNTFGNTASFSSTVNAAADVATTIVAASATVATGQTGQFNVTFSNASGASSAASPTLQVQLPTGLAGVVVTVDAGTTASYSATTGIVTYTYTAGALPGGTTINSNIKFTVPASGSVTASSAIGTTTGELGRTANNAASATISSTSVFDVTTTITGPATTVAGTLTTYSLVTTNNGPSTATAIGQSVQIGANLTNVFVSNGGTYNSTTGAVTFPSLATLVSGGVVNNTISFVAPTTAITATATVTGDANTANNTAVANTTVTGASTTDANVYTSISAAQGGAATANVAPGSAITFTVVAGNKGPNAATNVVERVSLPTGLTGVTITNPDGTTVTGASYSATTGVVTFASVGSLASAASNTYIVTVNAPASGLVAAVASITASTNDVMVADNVATADVTVNTPGDVATTLTGPLEVAAGQSVTYTVTTANNGLAPAANVVQTVTIPAGLASVNLTGSGMYDRNTGVVTFPTIANQASGSSVLNSITYTAPASSSLLNVASVTAASPDNVRTNNRSAVATTVDPVTDVTVAISGPPSIVQGNQIDYAVVVTNNGPSAATNVVARVQLPAGLNTSFDPATPNVVLSTGGTYDNATGIVTFTALGSQAVGSSGTVTNVVRVRFAPAGLNQINATATVSVPSTLEESNYMNNVANIITTELAPTTVKTDLRNTVAFTPASPNAGDAVTLTVTTTNFNTSTGPATNVVQRVALDAGLTITSISNGGTYDPTTGVVTFPAIASLAVGATTTNTIELVASGSPSIQARAFVSGDQSDPTPGNNSTLTDITVAARADVATAVSGPTTVAAGDMVTYSVLTLNNGPSPAGGVVQTVTIPSGLAAGTVTVSGGGTYNMATGVVTFPTITSEASGAAGQVTNTITFTATGSTYSVVGNVTTTTTEITPPGTTNNTSRVDVAPGNMAPIANAVINTLQTPEGNTAGPLLISPLSGTDANGVNTLKSFTLTSIPDATTQGVLTLNGTALAVNSTVLAADFDKLKFDPVSTFVGNAFFGYTVTDNSNVVSAASALYTIAVGTDISSTYATYNSLKGSTSANKYVNGDVLAQVTDRNAALYTAAGIIFDATTGAQQAGALNGIATAALSPTGPASNPANTLPAGISLDPATGRIFVSDATKLVNNATAQTYSVNVTTVDLNGGVTTVPVTFSIGAYPLPVELTAFTAQAVQNRDALLSWTTASELNSASFDIERSLDGTRFTKIGQLAAKGNATGSSSYTFTDASVAARASGAVYYRLRQVDLDATATYSPVRTVSFSKVAAVALGLYPNPAQNATTLDVRALPATATYQVRVLDATGRAVLTLPVAGGQLQPLNLTGLATGTYHVLVTGTLADGSALRQVLRLTKE